MTSAPALVITPITRRADHAETDGLERLWVAYKREDTRRRWSQAVGGLVWAAAWTAVAAGLWRSGTASMYAPAIQLLALTGWLAVLPALEGTLGALLIRSALLGGAVGLVAVPFLLDAPRNGLSISVVIALSLFLSGLAFRGLRNEMRSRHEQLWTAVLDGHSYLLTDDANALRWFIARNAGIGAFLNVCAGRLSRIVDRARDIEPLLLNSRGAEHDRWLREIRTLDRRMALVSQAIFLSVLAAVLICAVVVLLFAAGPTGAAASCGGV